MLIMIFIGCSISKYEAQIELVDETIDTSTNTLNQYFLVYNFDFKKRSYDSIVKYSAGLKYDLSQNYSASFYDYSEQLKILFDNKIYEVDLDSHGEDCVFELYYDSKFKSHSYTYIDHGKTFEHTSVFQE